MQVSIKKKITPRKVGARFIHSIDVHRVLAHTKDPIQNLPKKRRRSCLPTPKQARLRSVSVLAQHAPKQNVHQFFSDKTSPTKHLQRKLFRLRSISTSFKAKCRHNAENILKKGSKPRTYSRENKKGKRNPRSKPRHLQD